MNLGDMKTVLRRTAGVDASDPLTTWINASLHEFEDFHPWPFLEAMAQQPTVAGNDVLALPSDFWMPIKARIVDRSLPLEFMGRIQFEEEISDPTVQGIPEFFTLIGMDNMILYKVPDAVYTVRLIYRIAVPDLVNDTDVPAIPPKYHWTIVEGAMAKALQGESEEDRAREAQDRFQSAMSSAVTSLSGRVHGDYSQVRDVMSYGPTRW